MCNILECHVELERRRKEIAFAMRQNLAKRVVEQQGQKTLPFFKTYLVNMGKALEFLGRWLQNRFMAENEQLSLSNCVVKGGISRKLGT